MTESPHCPRVPKVRFTHLIKALYFYRQRSEASEGYVFTGVCHFNRVLYSGKQTDATAIEPVAYWLEINDVIWAGGTHPLLECILVIFYLCCSCFCFMIFSGLSLHLNHLIGSWVRNYDWPFGTLPFGLFGSNLDTMDLETYPRTHCGHFWHMSFFDNSRGVWVFSKNGCSQKIKIFSMKERSLRGFAIQFSWAKWLG